MGNGLMVAGLGMLIIFLILGILILFIYGFSYLINLKKKSTKTNISKNNFDLKTVAAITACISFFYEAEEKRQVDFVVKSIKRR